MTIFALIAALVTWFSVVPATAGPVLSADQQRRLDGGEVILLDVLPPGGGAVTGQGGTALSVVHASSEKVWNVLTDYPRHVGLYPRVVTAKVVESDAGRALVRYVVGVGPFSFGFHVDNFPDEGRHRIEWRLARSRPNDLFRDSWGYWEIAPGTNGVLLTYAMGARTVLPAFLTRGAERDGLVETVKAVRERAEHARP